jgi:hypothetical protein
MYMYVCMCVSLCVCVCVCERLTQGQSEQGVLRVLWCRSGLGLVRNGSWAGSVVRQPLCHSLALSLLRQSIPLQLFANGLPATGAYGQLWIFTIGEEGSRLCRKALGVMWCVRQRTWLGWRWGEWRGGGGGKKV